MKIGFHQASTNQQLFLKVPYFAVVLRRHFIRNALLLGNIFSSNMPTLMYRGGRMVGRICWKPVPIKLLKYVIYKTAFLYMKRLIKEIYGLRQALAGTHYSAWQRMYIWNAAIEKCKWFIEFSVLNLAIKCAATSKIIFHLSSRQSSLGHILLWRYFLRKTKSQ